MSERRGRARTGRTQVVPSKSQIDRLGDRLKAAEPSEQDLRDIDAFRLSFGPAYTHVVRTLEGMGVAPSGRPAKSTASIVEKLRRESARLSQIQDIAGCRIVVEHAPEQRVLALILQSTFPDAVVIDRLAKPSHGYRAVHVVVRIEGIPVEIQVRTRLQHLWAQASELAADVFDPSIKYGGGPQEWKTELSLASIEISLLEKLEDSVQGGVSSLDEWSSATNALESGIAIHLEQDPDSESIVDLRRRLGEMKQRQERARLDMEEAVVWAEEARAATVARMNSMLQTLLDLDRGPR